MKTHIVVEKRGKKEDNELELAFRRICDGESSLPRDLPFSLIFADKKANSTGLQLADLVARPIGLHIIRPQQNNQAFEVLEKKLYSSKGRQSAGSYYDGYGLKCFP